MTEQNGSASPILSAASTTKKRKRPTTRGPLKIGRPGKEKLRALSETIGNIVYVPVGELREAEYNPNVMSDAEIKRLASSLKQYGFVDPIIANLRTRTIVGGHQRLKAAIKLGMDEVPVLWLNVDERTEREINIALNKHSGSFDDEKLVAMLKGFSEGDDDFDFGPLGFADDEIEDLFGLPNPDAVYSRNIQVPVYEPSETPPAVGELVDTEKADALKAEIDAADIPEDVAAFLRLAADRHIRFDFHRIADYYASASAPVQALMERSALVIIDMDKAIENGFVRMTKTLCELVGVEKPDA